MTLSNSSTGTAQIGVTGLAGCSADTDDDGLMDGTEVAGHEAERDTHDEGEEDRDQGTPAEPGVARVHPSPGRSIAPPLGGVAAAR